MKKLWMLALAATAAQANPQLPATAPKPTAAPSTVTVTATSVSTVTVVKMETAAAPVSSAAPEPAVMKSAVCYRFNVEKKLEESWKEVEVGLPEKFNLKASFPVHILARNPMNRFWHGMFTCSNAEKKDDYRCYSNDDRGIFRLVQKDGKFQFTIDEDEFLDLGYEEDEDLVVLTPLAPFFSAGRKIPCKSMPKPGT